MLLTDGTEQSVTADDDYLRESILYPRAKIVKGFPPGLMPTYQGQISEEQLVSLVAYIKSMHPAARSSDSCSPASACRSRAPARRTCPRGSRGIRGSGSRRG